MTRAGSRPADGVWAAQPGLGHPTLQLMEDEGLMRQRGERGRRRFHVTEGGPGGRHHGPGAARTTRRATGRSSATTDVFQWSEPRSEIFGIMRSALRQRFEGGPATWQRGPLAGAQRRPSASFYAILADDDTHE